MHPLPRALLLIALASCPAFAGSPTTTDDMASMTGMTVPAGPAPVVNKIDPNRIHSLVLSDKVNALVDSGLKGYGTNFMAGATNKDDAQAILVKMAGVIQKYAKTKEFSTIGSQTVQKIADSIKTDADFWKCKDELAQLPGMLQAQLAKDEFILSHDMTHLSPVDQAHYTALTDDYNKDMMPVSGTMTADMSAGDKPPLRAEVLPPHGIVPAAPESDSIMTRFHNDYTDATKAWNSSNTGVNPVPATPATPATPVTPGGTGGTSNGSTAGGPGTAPAFPVDPPGYPPLDHIDHMISASPSTPANWQLRADYKLQTGDFAGAASDAERALSLGGGVAARVSLGEAQLSLGDKPAAYGTARAALESDPTNRRALAVLHFSEAHSSVGAPKALSFGDASGAGVAGAPRGSAAGLVNGGAAPLSSADLRREIGNALRLNDLDGALSYVNRGLTQDPNNPALLNIRASIFARQQNYEKAIADAKAGLALAPGNKTLLRTLAVAQVRGGHPKDALASAGELLALDPNDAYALALRGHAYGSMGDRDAMMSDLNRAAALDPRFQDAASRMAALVELPSNKDMLFLFPGETAPGAARTAAPAGRGRSFSLLVGASALGGLLLALGLLQTVMAPLKDKLTSAFTRATRGGASAAANDTAQPASVNGLVPGLIRGQYEISRQIGQGGMGMVFAGTDRSLGRPVAIKKMREELRVNPQERARFVIEAKTVAALHHPNIVDIYAIAEDGADVYLIFEFVDGKTVHDLVQGAGRLPIAEAARVVRAAADALGYAHSRGVVHRDMKPSNMMLDAQGRVKVMDFGIARMAKDTMLRHSMTNTVVGTPPYMAPEQEQGQVRKESDVYALAVCAYEMLTGKLPFIGIGAGMLMNKINMSYVAPSRAIAGLPDSLDEVFAKALQADPDKRYRTPQEFADALEAASGAESRLG